MKNINHLLSIATMAGLGGNKEKYEKDRAAFEKEQSKARERLEKAGK